MAHNRDWRIWLGLSVGLLALTASLVFTGRDAFSSIRRLRSSDRPALVASGDHIRDEIRGFYAKHGGLPISLEVAGIRELGTQYGYWRYRVVNPSSVDGYQLALGDYLWNGFVLFWSESRGDGWYWDT